MISPVWKVVSERYYVLAQWDDQIVLFHRPSGHTHFINAAMSQLLTALTGGHLSTDALIDRLFGTHEEHGRAAFRGHILNLLQRLDELGLIERVSSADVA